MDSTMKRKPTRNRRRESEVRFEDFFEQSLSMLVIVDLKAGRVLRANAAAAAFYGYPLEDLEGMPIAEINALPGEVFVERMVALATGPQKHFAGRHRLASGELRDVEVFWTPVESEGGGTFCLTVHDVTERASFERRLTETVAELQDLYDAAPCGYHSLATDGTYLKINATELEWLGCSREEVIGKLRLTDFLTPESQEIFALEFPAFLRRGFCDNIDVELVGRHGVRRHVRISATLLRDADGNTLMTRSIMFDITARKRADEEQRVLLETELSGVAKLDDRHVVWINRAAERMLGYEPGELVGAPTRILYADNERYEALGRTLYPAVASGVPFRTQLTLLRKDGTPLWVDLSATALPGSSSVIVMVSDLTEMHRRHEQIRELGRRIDSIREEERRALARALHEGIAQDLTGADLLLASHPPTVPAGSDGERLWSELRAIIKSAIASVRDLSNEARPEGLEHASLITVLRAHAERIAARTAISIEVEGTDPGPLLSSAARLALFRGAQEALTNAAKHAHATQVRLTLDSAYGRTMLEVSDNGRGILPGEERKPGSYGLLALRERFSEIGGEVSIASWLGTGTTLTFTVPSG
jgi:PAS domain S-box-containing protein